MDKIEKMNRETLIQECLKHLNENFLIPLKTYVTIDGIQGKDIEGTITEEGIEFTIKDKQGNLSNPELFKNATCWVKVWETIDNDFMRDVLKNLKNNL